MPDALYLQLIEKMLSDPELKAKIDEGTIEKLRKLLSGSKLPSRVDLAAILGEDKV